MKKIVFLVLGIILVTSSILTGCGQEKTQVNQPYLGIHYEHHISPGFLGPKDYDQGVRVVKVIEATAAERAGLQRGDTIIAINEEEVAGPDQFPEVFYQYNPGDEVILSIIRGGEEITILVVLGKR